MSALMVDDKDGLKIFYKSTESTKKAEKLVTSCPWIHPLEELSRRKRAREREILLNFEKHKDKKNSQRTGIEIQIYILQFLYSWPLLTGCSYILWSRCYQHYQLFYRHTFKNKNFFKMMISFCLSCNLIYNWKQITSLHRKLTTYSNLNYRNKFSKYLNS